MAGMKQRYDINSMNAISHSSIEFNAMDMVNGAQINCGLIEYSMTDNIHKNDYDDQQYCTNVFHN